MAARTIVMIHGMWGTPHVWRNFRGFFEARGWHVLTPALRHHDVDPLTAPEGLGETGLDDYVEDLAERLARLPQKPVIVGHSMGGLIAQKLAERGLASGLALLCPAPPAGILALSLSGLRAFLAVQTKWNWWKRPHRPTFGAAMYGSFNTTPKLEAGREYARFVHDSGRALAQIALPFLDRTRAATVDPAKIRAPTLVISAGQDRLIPPRVVRAIARRYAHVAEHHEFPEQGHWVVGQPGWQDVAACIAEWLDRNVSPEGRNTVEDLRAWRSSLSRS